MKLLEKAIVQISPSWALKRQLARQHLAVLNTGYSNHGASTTKSSMLGWLSRGGGVKNDIYKNRDRLVERSRDLYMGAPTATGVIKTIVSNTVGSGLRLKSAIDYELLGLDENTAEEIETQIEREFRLWSESKIDQNGLLDFYQVQDLVFLTVLLSGECFIKLNYFETPRNPYHLKLLVIEPDRVLTPNDKTNDKSVICGVQLDKKTNWITGYYVAKEHPLDTYSGSTDTVYVPVYGKSNQRNIIHLINPERPEQLRGVPLLSPVIEALKQLDRYTDAELMAAVISGMYAVFIESDKDNVTPADIGEQSIVSPEESVVSSSYDDDDTGALDIEMTPGMIVGFRPGERANPNNPGRPNAQFDPFVTAILRQIGAALEVPYELLVKHFSASYSASRAALLEAWKMFRKRRDWFASNFTQLIYQEWLREAVLRGRIELYNFGTDPLYDKAWSTAQWNGPSQGQIDPLKEAKASALKIQEGLSTRSRESVELNGGDFEQNVRILAKEQKILKEKGVTLGNAKNDESEEKVLEPSEE
ncbi:hypothetical protein IX317_000632 [Fusobacterium sp. DD29]|nr:MULTISPECIES: phage portal protein [unclassified Fusobacterium]MBR8748971.1 hypothetical protein [Fusobacterium sp. DD29]MBR8761277.1 hypothetical protein [Fusobacterium sp. DD25]MBR8767231.1 hypothetical protein [Fusobacterium sp. DD43]MBR8771300.1 hypothetical protein [Fusobacterium sp. DD40]MBR8775507.1 hypothetical protein [Fusobacterium sp. DD17]